MPRYGVEADVDFVNEIGGVADAHERAPRVDVVLPTVEFLVTLQCKVILLVFGF
jgi:hypothetical protein